MTMKTNEQFPQTAEAILTPEEQERMKLSVYRFFEGKLTELEATSGSGSVDYVQRFYELCSDKTEPWTRKKEFDLLGLAVPLRIRFDQNSHYDVANRCISIDIRPLLQAKGQEALKQAVIPILEDVYHEAEHIFNPGLGESHFVPEYDTEESSLLYLSDPAEINAFARQFAFRYAREYPGAPFDLPKMSILAEQDLKDEKRFKRNAAYNYFIACADMVKQQKYKGFNLKSIHEAIIAETRKHLARLRQTI